MKCLPNATMSAAPLSTAAIAIVGDLFTVVPQLTEEISKRKG